LAARDATLTDLVTGRTLEEAYFDAVGPAARIDPGTGATGAGGVTGAGAGASRGGRRRGGRRDGRGALREDAR
jgi:hypothetical protein